MKKIKVTADRINERIDKFLNDNLEIPRNQVQILIKNNLITVNGKNTKANYKIKEDDIIIIKENPEEIKPIEQKIKKLPKIKIIEENDEFIVINKPSGLIVHGGEGIKEATLVDIILAKWPSLSKIGDDPERPAIVHRLDKDVSGIMVIPKTQASYENIKNQFIKRTVNKEYTALVHGKIIKKEDEINFPIRRSSQGYKMAAIPETNKGEKTIDGRRAVTRFEIIKDFINFTLVGVKIITGRTHQIRVHLSAYGHPIVGDNLYSTKRCKEKNEKLNLNRIFLFAHKLEFSNLAGEKNVFKIKTPKELMDILKIVK